MNFNLSFNPKIKGNSFETWPSSLKLLQPLYSDGCTHMSGIIFYICGSVWQCVKCSLFCLINGLQWQPVSAERPGRAGSFPPEDGTVNTGGMLISLRSLEVPGCWRCRDAGAAARWLVQQERWLPLCCCWDDFTNDTCSPRTCFRDLVLIVNWWGRLLVPGKPLAMV